MATLFTLLYYLTSHLPPPPLQCSGRAGMTHGMTQQVGNTGVRCFFAVQNCHKVTPKLLPAIVDK